MLALHLIFNTWFWIFFALTSLILCPFNLLLRILTFSFDPNGKIIHQVSCFWAALYLWFSPYWSLKIEGLEKVDKRKAYVIVANHSSLIDILVVFATFLNFKWLSKKSVLKIPLLGWNMRLNKYVIVDRKDPDSRKKSMAASKKWLKQGMSMLFFPEGTRSPDGQLASFQSGAFRLATELEIDILPIVIHGTAQALPKHSRLIKKRSRMQAKVLDIITVNSLINPGEGPEELEKLMQKTHSVMQKELQQFT